MWSFAPTYELLLRSKGTNAVWSLRTVQHINAFLTTTQNGVNQMTVTLADTDQFIRNTVKPRAMDLVQLKLTNRYGHSAVAWTGYIDTFQRAFNPQEGDVVTLSCTGTVKLFEITRQTPQQTSDLAATFAANVTGSTILGYAANKCKFPSSMIYLDPVADSGTGFQPVAGSQFTSPDQQTYTSVVSTVQAQSGIEWFFSETGALYWRQLNFIAPWFPGGPRPPSVIQAHDIIQASFIETDDNVVTEIEVRSSNLASQIGPSSGFWRAPGLLEDQIKPRILTIYASWLTSQPALQYLATILGEQYAANVLQGAVSIPADPLIKLGSLVQVPNLGRGGVSLYYVNSITYQLAWGASWVMTLTLSYGHAVGTSFPYIGAVSFPAPTSTQRTGLPTSTEIAHTKGVQDPENTAWDLKPYTLETITSAASQAFTRPVAQTSLSAATIISGFGRVLTKTQVAWDGNGDATTGSTIWLYTKPRSAGKLIGTFTIVAPYPGQDATTLVSPGISSTQTVYVTTIAQDTYNPSAGPGTVPPTRDRTNYGAVVGSPPDQVSNPQTLAQRAYNSAVTLYHMPYILYHAGEDGWDCSGLITWAYAKLNVGINEIFWYNQSVGINGPTPGQNDDGGPLGIYNFFYKRGALPFGSDDDGTTVASQAALGDLIFCYRSGDLAGGYSHVAFATGDGDTSYGANGPTGTNTIDVRHIVGYPSDTGAYFTKGLHMAPVR